MKSESRLDTLLVELKAITANIQHERQAVDTRELVGFAKTLVRIAEDVLAVVEAKVSRRGSERKL